MLNLPFLSQQTILITAKWKKSGNLNLLIQVFILSIYSNAMQEN